MESGKGFFLGGQNFTFWGVRGTFFGGFVTFPVRGCCFSREGVLPLLDHILLTTTIKWYYRINDLLFLLQFNHHPWFWSFEGNWCICCDWHHPPNSVYKNWLFSALGSPINEVKKGKCSQFHCEFAQQCSQRLDRMQKPPKRRENVMSSASSKGTQIIIQVISIDIRDFL